MRAADAGSARSGSQTPGALLGCPIALAFCLYFVSGRARRRKLAVAVLVAFLSLALVYAAIPMTVPVGYPILVPGLLGWMMATLTLSKAARKRHAPPLLISDARHAGDAQLPAV
jgi:L-lactate permease